MTTTKDSKSIENVQERYDSLKSRLQACKTASDLFKLAQADDFKDAAQSLPETFLRELRKDYRSMQVQLDGKVKLEEYDGQVISIVDIDYWYSEEWGNEGVTLKYHPERTPDKTFKSLTSSSVWLKFAKGFDTPPTEANPARVQIHLEPVKDPERAKQGQRVWKVKRLAIKEENTGFPF